MNTLKIYDEEEYRSYEDLEAYYPGITTECFKNWKEMAKFVNTIYGYPIMKKCTDMGAKEYLEDTAHKTTKLRALINAMIERWWNENIEYFIGEQFDGMRCDLDMELENLIFNIVDGNISETGIFLAQFVIGDNLWFSIPQILIDFFKKH